MNDKWVWHDLDISDELTEKLEKEAKRNNMSFEEFFNYMLWSGVIHDNMKKSLETAKNDDDRLKIKSKSFIDLYRAKNRIYDFTEKERQESCKHINSK